VAFATVLVTSIVIYLVGRLKAPKPPRNREKLSMYACGERVRSSRLNVNITFYKYLVYFVILDTSILMIAFASLASDLSVLLTLLIYLLTVLTAIIVLAMGGD